MNILRISRNPRFFKFLSKATSIILLAAMSFVNTHYANAAQATSMKAVFDRLKASTATGGITLTFATPTGIQTGGGDTITLTFSADFTVAATAVANFDVGLGDSGTCTTATYTDETIAASPSATEWGVSVSGQVITFSPETDDTLTAGYCIKIEMGDDATTGGTGSTSTITNGAADDDDTIAIGGSIGDSGTIAVDIISDDQVAITATVNSTITFTISDNTIEFGTLSSSAATWADDSAGSATDTAAHTMTVATNADNGYAVTYNGATLTSGSNTIDVASVTNDADGTPGSEQFGMGFSVSGDATVAAAYDHNATSGSRDWAFVASTTTTVVSETGPTATETISAFYLANISGITEAGAYSTTVTYIATGTF